MTDIERAWVAGILEGEGCFAMRWMSSRLDLYPAFQVRCNMTDEDVIRRLHATVGAGMVVGPIIKKDPKYKPQWLWTLGRRAGIHEFLLEIRPFMCSRRGAKIDEMLVALDAYPIRSWRHGTRQAYEAIGCRCDACRESNATRHRERRARHRAIVDIAGYAAIYGELAE